MKFTYINYGDNIMRKLKSNGETIIVFCDYFLKNFYLKNREKNIFVPEGKYFTLDEFQKKIFVTEKMILTEAKRPLTLYRVLNKELKEKLKIQNYYDIIDFADLFFKHYKELAFAVKKEVSGLQNWQKEYVERFDILKKEYDRYLDENDFIPSDWIENIENYSSEFLKGYKKIIFADIPYFTPLMKEALKKMEDAIEIEIMLQIPKEDYNEKEMKIERVSFSKEDIKCRVYENSDNMSEFINLIYLLREEKKERNTAKDVFSPAAENSRYSEVFPKYFVSQKMAVLEDTKLYEFMKIQNELLLSLEPKKRYGIPAEELKSALNSKIFKKVYEIDEEIKEKFNMIFSDEYKYIDEKLFSDVEKFSKEEDLYYKFHDIYSDLMRIREYKTVDEFVDYIKETGFEVFRENNYLDIIEKFYQAVDNIKTSEKLCGNGGFKELFENNTGANLYTLLIKYMEGIEIREVGRKKEDVLGIVKKLSDARMKSGGTSYFVDIDSVSLPGNLKDDMIFTEGQRAENGFMTFEEKKLISKYRFVQGVFNCSQSVIFTKNIEAEELGNSVFLDELIFKYNLKTEKNPLTKDEIFQIIKNSFEKGEIFEKEKTEEYFNLAKDRADFKEGKIVLGAYDIMNIKDCEYKYFLEKTAGIYAEEEESYGTSMRFLGIVTHKIFEDVSREVYGDIKKNNNYNVNEGFVDRVLDKTLRDNTMKIPAYMDLFFKEIMFPKIKENLLSFYKEAEKDLKGKKIKIFWGEKSDFDKEPFFSSDIDVFIKGRADLIIETEDDEKYIIDYKTGKGRTEQLDIYSVIMYGDENAALKRIYNVIKGEYVKIDKAKITKEEMKNLFEDFITEKYYKRAEQKTVCSRCNYLGICRREVI